MGHRIGIGQTLSFCTPLPACYTGSMYGNTVLNRFDLVLGVAQLSQNFLRLYRSVNMMVFIECFVFKSLLEKLAHFCKCYPWVLHEKVAKQLEYLLNAVIIMEQGCDLNNF